MECIDIPQRSFNQKKKRYLSAISIHKTLMIERMEDDLPFYVLFLTVFQPYQEDGWLIIKSCV